MNQNELLTAGKPIIVLHDANPLIMLEVEFSLRDLVGDAAQLAVLPKPSDVAPLALNADVVLLLLDGDIKQPAYAPLDLQDPRIVWLTHRPFANASRRALEKRPTSYALLQLTEIINVLRSK